MDGNRLRSGFRVPQGRARSTSWTGVQQERRLSFLSVVSDWQNKGACAPVAAVSESIQALYECHSVGCLQLGKLSPVRFSAMCTTTTVACRVQGLQDSAMNGRLRGHDSLEIKVEHSIEFIPC